MGAAALGGGGALALTSRGDRPRPASVVNRGMNVVLIGLDTLRADHVGAYRADAIRPDRAVQTPTIDAYDPHEPWDPPRSYVDRYDDPDYDGIEPIQPLYGGDDYLDERLLTRTRALYAGELTLADHWMGSFLQRLDELGLADSTLVVFYSDHGHSLGERGVVGKSPSQLYAEMVDVPLVVRHPEGAGAGRTTDFLASLHDLAPTILAATGVAVPAEMEGIDLTPLLAGDEAAQERAVQTAGYNDYVWAGDERMTLIASNRKYNPKLFDREEDPGERRNLADERPDEVDRLWDAVIADAGGKPPPRY